MIKDTTFTYDQIVSMCNKICEEPIPEKDRNGVGYGLALLISQVRERSIERAEAHAIHP